MSWRETRCNKMGGQVGQDLRADFISSCFFKIPPKGKLWEAEIPFSPYFVHQLSPNLRHTSFGLFISVSTSHLSVGGRNIPNGSHEGQQGPPHP